MTSLENDSDNINLPESTPGQLGYSQNKLELPGVSNSHHKLIGILALGMIIIFGFLYYFLVTCRNNKDKMKKRNEYNECDQEEDDEDDEIQLKKLRRELDSDEEDHH